MKKQKLLKEWEDVCTVIALREADEDSKIEIIDSLGMKKYVELAMGYFPLSSKSLYVLKRDTERRLLKHINISELTPFLTLIKKP